MHKSILFGILCVTWHISTCLAATLPVQRRTNGLSQRRGTPCPPARTLPSIDASNTNYRFSMEFLREWCPPSIPITFPETPTSTWRRTRNSQNSIPSSSSNSRRHRNPHRGMVIEGGSNRITFPDEHLDDQTPRRDSLSQRPRRPSHHQRRQQSSRRGRLPEQGSSQHQRRRHGFRRGRLPEQGSEWREDHPDEQFLNSKMHPNLRRWYHRRRT